MQLDQLPKPKDPMEIASVGYIKNFIRDISAYLARKEIKNLLFVDASCLYKNDQITQWSVVKTNLDWESSGAPLLERVFTSEPYYDGTINIGEYLAIQTACDMFVSEGNTLIMSDSKIAIQWHSAGHKNSKQPITDRNAELMRLFDEASKRSRMTRYNEQFAFLHFFQSKFYGTNPADFSRK